MDTFRCHEGDHDEFYPKALYVIDSSGKISTIGSADGGYHTIHWAQDHWIVITNAYFNETYQNHHLWNIVQQNGMWVKAQDISLGTMTDNNFSAGIDDGDHSIQITETDRIRYVPCEIDPRYDGYYILTTVITPFRQSGVLYIQEPQTILPRLWPRNSKIGPWYQVARWQTLCVHF